jgi:hypothetical protein
LIQRGLVRREAPDTMPRLAALEHPDRRHLRELIQNERSYSK